ncbi:TPA: hypothetical protein QDB05_004314 [Burkholderia vietnamiensis]|nr:hypothetical protein [Burkholderia vietnamiensis]
MADRSVIAAFRKDASPQYFMKRRDRTGRAARAVDCPLAIVRTAPPITHPSPTASAHMDRIDAMKAFVVTPARAVAADVRRPRMRIAARPFLETHTSTALSHRTTRTIRPSATPPQHADPGHRRTSQETRT